MTSRRSFFSTIATAVAGFAILPPATTYARVWKAQRSIPNPDYVEAPYEVKFLWKPGDVYGRWQFFGVTCAAEIQSCMDKQEKFVVTCDKDPFKFPEIQDVWPEKPLRFRLDQGNVLRRVES